MRIHLGHHFYGAGNLGDDFMLAGFLSAMRFLLPDATFTSSVPFALEPLRRRFPAVNWIPYTSEQRRRSIQSADVWLGLGGSPFQSAQSRWFIDHLLEDAAACRQYGRPMYYLGVGVQTEAELASGEVGGLCAQAGAVWTRDDASARRLAAVSPRTSIRAAADLAHLYFREVPPPAASTGRVTLVANFDYGTWSGLNATLDAIDALSLREHIWLAQETRELPGAERALFATLSPEVRQRWKLTVPDEPDSEGHSTANLLEVLARWPSAEWLVTSRFHAALAGAWSGSRIVVIGINEKLRGVAAEIGAPCISTDCDAGTAIAALKQARPGIPPTGQAERAFAACADFVSRVRHA